MQFIVYQLCSNAVKKEVGSLKSVRRKAQLKKRSGKNTTLILRKAIKTEGLQTYECLVQMFGEFREMS